MWRVRLNSVRTATLDIMHSATEEAFLLLLVEAYCSIMFFYSVVNLTSDLMLLLFCRQQTWSNVWFGHVSIFDDIIIIISSEHVVHIWTFCSFSVICSELHLHELYAQLWLIIITSTNTNNPLKVSLWTHFCRKFFKLSELRVTSVFSACSSHPAAWSRICLLVSLPFGQSCK